MKVAVIGAGAVGGVVARALAAGDVRGADLVGVLTRGPATAGPCSTDVDGLPLLDARAVVEVADLVVECAGHAALAEHGPAVVAAGRELLVVSVGALTDDALLTRLAAGPGRVHLSTGAIGGLDVLRAAALMGGLDRVQVTTTKSAAALLAAPDVPAGPVTLRSGSARQIAAAFPRSTNVVAAVALAVGGWDVVWASVVADPDAEHTSHLVEASGPAGRYRIEIRNAPSDRTPTTSAITPYAVLRALGDLAGSGMVLR